MVIPEETGVLVPLTLKPGSFDPLDPDRFSADLAAAINRVARDPVLQARFGQAGRRRVEEHFSWEAIAQKTLALYRSLVA